MPSMLKDWGPTAVSCFRPEPLHIHIHIYIYMYVYIHIYVYVYRYIYIYIYLHVHTQRTPAFIVQCPHAKRHCASGSVPKLCYRQASCPGNSDISRAGPAVGAVSGSSRGHTWTSHVPDIAALRSLILGSGQCCACFGGQETPQ